MSEIFTPEEMRTGIAHALGAARAFGLSVAEDGEQ